MAASRQPSILHADLDAFYASVEQLLDPSLRGLPIAVGGGVVLAASYEAKAFGVRGGMPGRQARALCPSLRFVGGHFREYQRLGDEVMAILRDFTPLVERISIDEAFLDVTGSTHLFGPPAAIAADLRGRVRDDVGLPISVGAATTKHLAKVASQVAKPDGVVVVEPGREQAFLDPLPVELLWGVGPVTRERLASVGIRTIGELAATSRPLLQRLLGEAAGATLGALAGNVDPRRVDAGRRAGSVGAQSAFGRRRVTDELLRSVLGYLADRVATRLRAGGRAGRTVTVRVRFPGLRSVTRSLTMAVPMASTLTLTEVGVGLAKAALADHADEREISLLAISVSHLAPAPMAQLELPLGLGAEAHRPGTRSNAARSAVDRAIDGIRERFGRGAVGFAGVTFSDTCPVPEAFRELAQHDEPDRGHVAEAGS
ncbi:MAG TPA: DNA polymerase IV [Acidimicrobiales bacterium]|nr:DNA polymerase IV [Acidimicrobiales bacterium]